MEAVVASFISTIKYPNLFFAIIYSYVVNLQDTEVEIDGRR